jgi:hypothetical protein
MNRHFGGCTRAVRLSDAMFGDPADQRLHPRMLPTSTRWNSPDVDAIRDSPLTTVPTDQLKRDDAPRRCERDAAHGAWRVGSESMERPEFDESTDGQARPTSLGPRQTRLRRLQGLQGANEAQRNERTLLHSF